MQSPPVKRAWSASVTSPAWPNRRGLVEAGVEIYSTGGTRKSLKGEGVPSATSPSTPAFPR